MRMILYRVKMTLPNTLETQAAQISGVLSAMQRTKGVLAECDDGITEEALTALDTLIRGQVAEVIDGPGPGRARGIPPGDDRTANVSP